MLTQKVERVDLNALARPPYSGWKRIAAHVRRRVSTSGLGSSRATSLPILLLLFTLPLHAHDIYTSFAEARLLSDKLELTITMARSCAHDILPDAKKLPAITPDNFAEFAPKLRAVKADLVRISAGGKPLTLLAGDAKISGDVDVTFVLTFAKPAASPLRFIVDYVGYLVDGHVATVVITNAAGDDLGWSPVSIDQPVFQIALPGASAPEKRK